MLREFVLEALGLLDPTELVTWVASASKAEIAALGPDVSRAASAGDAGASEILERAVESLTHHVTTVIERSGPWSEQPRVALGGGLIRKGGPVRAALLAALSSYQVSVIERELDPPMGAARKALALNLPGRQ